MFLVAVDTRSPMPNAIYKCEDTGMSHPAIWDNAVGEVEAMSEDGKDFSPIHGLTFRNDWRECEKQMTAEEVYKASRPDEEGGVKSLDEILGFRPDSVVIDVEGGQIVYKTM